VDVNGLRFGDWLLTRLDRVAAMASKVSSVSNWAIGNRPMRWLLEKTTGIAHSRKLPRLAARNFLRRAHRRKLTRPKRAGENKVVYFVDVYANWFDPELGESLLAILEHNGISVFVPPNQFAAGMPAIALGALDRARKLAKRNVAVLAEAVRQGYHIVTTEPAASMCLRYEYPNLLDDDDARLVAENASDATEYLWRLHQNGRLELDLRPVNTAVGYHLPCHLRALNLGSPGESLLRLIPGLTLRRIEKGCSGMAGTWGLKRKNYRTSLRIGWGLISALRDQDLQAGTTECSTCKMQMEHGAGKTVVHPLRILALAYGLLPGNADLWTPHGHDDLVLS
jgi:Fe-S oxidoreductase